MTDDNSRGRGLKSSLKNECERDKCMRKYARARTHVRTHIHTYVHLRAQRHTHETWLAETSDGDRTE